MLTKRIAPEIEDGAPHMDEGWWSSVLADEDAYMLTHQDNLMRIDTASNPCQVDWDSVKRLYERDEIVALMVNGCNRGGLLVQGDGIQGFVPVSHLIGLPSNLGDEQRQARLSEYLGQTLSLKVIECEPSLERVVLSERAAQAGEGRRKQLFQLLKVGDNVNGIVTNITDFGAFVDLGGVEGLIHVSELSWGRVQRPADILRLGQEVETLVLNVTEENSRVALSLKRLCPNPWESLVEHHKPGDAVEATVTSVMRFGVFARLPEGVEGLIHISSIAQVHDSKNLEAIFQTGQVIQAQILHIDIARRRLGLGLVKPE